MPTPILLAFLIGVAVALIRRRLPAAPTSHDDAPARLVGWSVGLLGAQRGDWGRAMVGELDRLDGRAERWPFALGCAAAAAVMPPTAQVVDDNLGTQAMLYLIALPLVTAAIGWAASAATARVRRRVDPSRSSLT